MFLSELSEPKLIVVYPGRFQPFHLGHKQAFEWLCGKFGRSNVYIATSDKVDGDRSPFSFGEKSYFMQLAGIPVDRIVQATSPYKINNVLSGGNIQVLDRNNTIVIFAVSKKDMEADPETGEGPRFDFAHKKDGTQGYYQPLPKDLSQTENMDQHGYILTVPTFDFTVLDEQIHSATSIRDMYRNADDKARRQIIADLFGQYTLEAQQILDNKLGRTVNEDKFDPAKRGLVAKARAQHPFANSDEEALALYVNDKEQHDIDHVEDEEHGLEARVSNLEKAFLKFKQPDVKEARMFNPKKVDLFFAPDRNSTKRSIVAKSIPFNGLDLLINALVKKFNVNKNDFHWSPVDEPFGKRISEAGVGVVKSGNDPRYMTATMGDQNDVDGNTLGREMKAYFPTKAPKSGQHHVSNNIGKGTKK